MKQKKLLKGIQQYTAFNTVINQNGYYNYENGTTSVPHRLLLYLSNEINIKRNDKYVALSNLSIYYTWENVKMSCENNKFKILAPA